MATHPCLGTGYARVANKLTNHLATLPGVEVVYFAFGNYKGGEINDRFVDPRIRFLDAVGALCDYKDFTDHLQYCFKNPDERPNARDYLKEKYSWDNMYKVLDAEFNTQNPHYLG